MNGRNLQVQIIQSYIHPGECSQSRLIRKPMTKHKTYAFSWDVLWLPMLSSPLLSWETMWLIHWDKEKISIISHMTFQNTNFSFITINRRFMNGRNLQVQIIQSYIHPGEYSQSRLIWKPMTKHKTYAFSWDVLWLPMLSSPLLSWETMWLIHWDKKKISINSHMTFQNVYFVWKLLYIHSNYIELYMQGFNQQ